MPKNKQAVTLGAGTLYTAALASPEPTDLLAAWPVAWTELGYTEEGSTVSYDVTSEGVVVAEEVDPIRNLTTGRNITVAFALAQITLTNLEIAYNGGTSVTAAGVITFEPPELGTEVSRMLGWQSEDLDERWVFRSARQSGSVAIARRKAPAKATLPVSYVLERPVPDDAPFKVLLDATTRTA